MNKLYSGEEKVQIVKADHSRQNKWEKQCGKMKNKLSEEPGRLVVM